MQKRTRSLLTELDELLVHKDKEHLLENRAQHVITGAINIINLIRESYDAETAGELERRLLNSIRHQDPSKFTRGIRKIKDEN